MFPELDDEQLAAVLALGERRQVREGEILFSPADDHYDWIVILSGRVEVLGPNGQLITSHGSRRFLGEVNLVTRQRPYLSTRVAQAGEVAVVPAEMFRSRADRPPAERCRPRGVPRPPGGVDVERCRHVADRRVPVHAGVDGTSRVRRPQPAATPVDRR